MADSTPNPYEAFLEDVIYIGVDTEDRPAGWIAVRGSCNLISGIGGVRYVYSAGCNSTPESQIAELNEVYGERWTDFPKAYVTPTDLDRIRHGIWNPSTSEWVEDFYFEDDELAY